MASDCGVVERALSVEFSPSHMIIMRRLPTYPGFDRVLIHTNNPRCILVQLEDDILVHPTTRWTDVLSTHGHQIVT